MAKSNVAHLALVPVDESPSEGYLDSWAVSLRGDGKHAVSTITLYRSCLNLFAAWLDDTGRSSDLLSVSKRDLDAYFAYLMDSGLSGNTRRTRYVALRSFYGWLAAEDEIATNPMARVKVARPVTQYTAILDDDQLARLVKECSGGSVWDRRDKAIILLMVTSGLRKSEVASLRVCDVDITTGIVLVEHGKGDKRRKAVMHPVAAHAVDKYLRMRRQHVNGYSDALWLGLKGRLTASGIDAMVRRRGRAAGMDGMRCHRLRHTWADRNKRAGMSDGDLMTLGGWSDRKMLDRYGAIAREDRAITAAQTTNAFTSL